MNALSQILTPARTVSCAARLSKKRLLETIATIVCEDQLILPYDEVLDQLIAREKLGSTGLGDGIAIPHCRVGHCAEPLGALITLEEPIAFDAPDDKPVDLLFVLLVPRKRISNISIYWQMSHDFSAKPTSVNVCARPGMTSNFMILHAIQQTDAGDIECG